MDCNLKRYCKWCWKELESTDRRHQVCNAECRKLYVKDYQKNIPIELKRIYEKRYLFTDKGKKYKSEKNRRYREKVLLLKLYWWKI